MVDDPQVAGSGPWRVLEPMRFDPDPATQVEGGAGDVATDGDGSGDDPRPVDRPVLAGMALYPWEVESGRRPVVAPWLAEPAARRAAIVWALRTGTHPLAFHLVRAPLYMARLAARSPAGAWRVGLWLARWAFDAQTGTLIGVTVAAGDAAQTPAFLALSRQRAERVKRRLSLVGGVVVGLAGGMSAAWFLEPAAFWVAVSSGVLALGAVGRRRDTPVVSQRLTAAAVAPRLTSEAVARALAAAVRTVTEAGVMFPAPIQRDGAGWRAEVDLPGAVTASDVIAQREPLSAALRRPVGCVWPEGAPDVHPGRVVLWVADHDLSKAKPVRWVLAERGTADLFAEIPFGVDVRGRPVGVSLMFASMIIGSVPRIGKTFTARLFLLAGALDHRVEIHAFDLKGTGDFSPLEPVSHRYRAGDDDDDVEYAVRDLRDLRVEMRRRAKVLRDLPRDQVPESKVTPGLASRRELGLHPVLLVADECQLWFEHKDHGEEIAEIVEDLVRRGPALGIIVVLATQRPDKKSLPTGISSNAIIRFALKVQSPEANNLILGQGMHGSGITATMFRRSDKGIGWLAGEADDPKIVRTAYVDAPAAEKITARARALRLAHGTLTGHSVGQEPEKGPDWSLVADLLTVMGEEQAHSEVLCARLAEHWPERYRGWTPTTLAGALKPHGVRTGPVWAVPAGGGEKTNRQGVKRPDLVAKAKNA